MRINLAQSCNGVGWIFGPILGGMFFYNSSGNVSSASSRLFVPYVAIACAALVLAAVFAKAYMPDVKAEDDYESEGAAEENVSSRSIWTHPHFVLAVFAQFFYVAAQAGIFAFFINYVVAEVPPISASIANLSLLHGGTVVRGGALYINEVGATKLLSAFGFTLFLLGRIVGTALMKSFKAHSILGIFALANTVLTALIFLKLGWLSVVCVFLTFFFMSIMFPTIFSLGIWGLGEKSKTAASFIVMAIMGGALLPKLMGEIADKYDMSKGFIVPMFCFAYVAFYAFSWARLRQKGGAHPVDEKSAERVLAAR
jgi:FHS family L-fucose permease-like MFS transporter